MIKTFVEPTVTGGVRTLKGNTYHNMTDDQLEKYAGSYALLDESGDPILEVDDDKDEAEDIEVDSSWAEEESDDGFSVEALAEAVSAAVTERLANEGDDEGG